MTSYAETMHSLLRSTCDDQVGIAIGKSLIAKLFRKSGDIAERIPAIRDGFVIPVDLLPSFPLQTRVTFDRGAIGIDFTGDEVVITGLSVILTIAVKDKGDISESAIDYGTIKALPILVDNKIEIHADDSGRITVATPQTLPTSDRPTILSDIGLTDPVDVAKFEVNEKAIVLIAIRMIRDSVIRTFSIPDVMAAFSGFEIGANSLLMARDGYLIVKADATPILGRCPNINARGETRVVATPAGDGSVRADVTHKPTEIGRSVTSDDIANGNSQAMDVYGFFPKKILEKSFEHNGLVPSATFQNRGSVGPIWWQYSCTGAIQRFTLSIDAIVPPRLVLDVPLEVTGQASAGVEILCVKYEAANVVWRGEVDPLDVIFEVSMDVHNGSVGLMTKFGEIDAKNFNFLTNPRKFPISEVADFVLARAAEVIIKNHADSLLNITRINLVDFSVLDNFTGFRKTVSQHATKGDSGQDNGSFMAGVMMEA